MEWHFNMEVELTDLHTCPPWAVFVFALPVPMVGLDLGTLVEPNSALIGLALKFGEVLPGERRGARLSLSSGDRGWSCVPVSEVSRALEDIGRDGRAVRIEPGSRSWASGPANGVIWLISMR